MTDRKPYFPHSVFLPAKGSGHPVPRVFVSPQRYIQGEGTFSGMGRYLSLLNTKQAGLLLSKRSQQNEGKTLQLSIEAAGIQANLSTFGGECSMEEINLHVAQFHANPVDCLVAIGGGKCLDAGKAIAWRLNIPVVIAPSLASNDAPCSALSVLYTPEGATVGGEFYPENPAIVVVDTSVVASAAPRFLVSGMGDAMATWYEAQACLANPRGATTTGTRPTLAANAIGEICASTLFTNGVAAADAVAKGTVTDELEHVVEANTLLSGLGFESGGLAAAHSVAQALTYLPAVEKNYLHGEMVAIGTITQLVIEKRMDELEKVMHFFADVGLPINLGQVSLSAKDAKTLKVLAEGAMAFPYIRNMPVPVSEEIVSQALVDADTAGRAIAESRGDRAYRKLHG